MSFGPTEPPRASEICPQQIVRSPFSGGAFATLSDIWGRIHPVANGLFVGRSSAGFPEELRIFQSSVSRWHARFFYEGGRWLIEDLNSKNGTYVGDVQVRGRLIVMSGDAVRFGDVEFGFSEQPCGRDMDLSWSTAEGTRKQACSLLTLALGNGRGGVVTYNERELSLSALPFALLESLIARSNNEQALPEDVRGFFPSRDLLTALPWTTPCPDENHLKQTVRRLRHGLQKLGLPGAIEARQGHGYRLRPNFEQRAAPPSS